MDKFLTSALRLINLIRNHKLTAGIVFGCLVLGAVTLSVGAASYDNRPSKTTTITSPGTAAVKSATTDETTPADTSSKVTTGTDKTTAQPAATPSPATAPAVKPASPTTKPTPTTPKATTLPHCPECGGDPDKTPSKTGTLVLSTNSVTVVAGQSYPSLLTAHSDSGETITQPFILIPGSAPVTTTTSAGGFGTYLANYPFGFVSSPGATPGTYSVTILASGANQGSYSTTLAVVVTAQ